MQKAFHKPLSSQLHEFYAAMGTTASLRTLVRELQELRDRDLVAEVSAIQIPTLICYGIHDTVVPIAAGKAQEQLIQGAKLLRFEESAHGIFFEEKDRLVQEFLNFIG